MEERGGSEKQRMARVLARGREDAAPVALHLSVVAAVGLLVAIILVVALVLWLVLR